MIRTVALSDDTAALLDAIAFAARAHDRQIRKDNRTPYVSHVYRVCMIARDLFGVVDRRVLIAAALHDTVEDTTTDHDDIAQRYSSEIAMWVAALSKDKRLPEAEREEAYGRQLAAAPWQVQVCKLADILDNVLDSESLTQEAKARGLRNASRYLAALKVDLKTEAQDAWQFVNRLVRERDSHAELP